LNKPTTLSESKCKSLKLMTLAFSTKKRNTHLHSKEHLLADDLSRAMFETRRFAAYLGIAKMYDESDLRALARRVAEKTDLPTEARGRYFFACLKGLPKKERATAVKRQKKGEVNSPE